MTPSKKVTGVNYDPWPFFLQHKIWPNFNICVTQFFPQLPVCALINDPEKKRYVRQLGPTTYFWQQKMWPNFIDMGHRASNTFAKLPVCALINDLKKSFEKSCMLPFPNDLRHFEICPTFDLAEIGQNVGYNLTIL